MSEKNFNVAALIFSTEMLKLTKQQYPFLKAYFSTCNDFLLGQCLTQRTVLQLSGNEAHIYLQGLITNDMSHLKGGASSIFAMFLNSKGRVLFDSVIYNAEKENTYYIECDRDASSSLKDHLLMYKVRRKVNIDYLQDEVNIWSVVDNRTFFNTTSASDYKKLLALIKQSIPNVTVSSDPRLPFLGLRIIAPKNFNTIKEFEKRIGVKIQEENFYKLLRYKLGVGEGLQELTYEKCLPLEANGDYLNGISFHKGCYIGQELTARTYHTGVIRKRLMPILFQEQVKISEHGIPIFPVPESNKSVGKLQGVEQNTGLGLLRIEEALKADELTVSDIKCKTHRPSWWPSDASG